MAGTELGREGDAAAPGLGEPTTVEDAVQLARAQQVALIGRQIRALRRERMTLSQLAEASNVSVGLLSRLENGVGNPSFAALAAIARALDVDVHSFFEPPANGGTVLSGDDRITLRVARTGVELELLVPSFRSRVIGVLITLPPGHAPDAQVPAHHGQQFEIVLSGSVEFRIEHETHQLESGDSVFFEASRPHVRRNMSTSTAATIMACATEIQLGSYFPPNS
jgi:transcriptional regulator with XRE-family HTH domain